MVLPMPDSDTVLRWAEISRRQLDHWVERGFIKPGTHSGRGFGGVQYDWSMDEAKVVQRMGRLVNAGLPPAMAHKLARGDDKALERLLFALKECVTELRWRVRPGTEVRGQLVELSEGAAEAEPCG